MGIIAQAQLSVHPYIININMQILDFFGSQRDVVVATRSVNYNSSWTLDLNLTFLAQQCRLSIHVMCDPHKMGADGSFL